MIKKFGRILTVMAGLAIFFLASCITAPEIRSKDIIISDKGSVEGLPTPAWVQVAIAGDARDLERLPEFSGMIVVVTSFESEMLPEAQSTANKMRAETEMGYFLSLRVQEILKNAKVPAQNYKTFAEYRVAFEDGVAEAIYPEFNPGPDWWVKFQSMNVEGKPGKQVFRVVKLWTIEKKILEKKFNAMLANIHGKTPTLPANVRAKNLIENTLGADFFGL